MKLTDKITSLEDYLQVELPICPPYGKRAGTVQSCWARSSAELTTPGSVIWMPNVSTGFASLTATERLPNNMWWAHREMLRLAYGVYTPHTQALAHLVNHYQFAHHFPHISVEDNNLIGYTASVDDGLRDRQTRVALGRFVRKTYLMMPDTMVASIEAAHRSELNPNVELIVAEGNKDAFREAYQSINSCMSKANSAYGGGNLMHPVEAYCTPGFHLAVLRNSQGNISARSLVWINPANAEDKRYVRTYGDTVLHTWLKRSGFKPLSFEGAYLKTQRYERQDEGDRKSIITPYVDPGTDCGESEHNYQGVWDGADKVYILKRSTKLKVPASYRCDLTSAGGTTHARAYPINRPCAITGVVINAFADSFVDVLIEGKKQIALATAAKDWKLVSYPSTQGVRVAPDTPVFRHGLATYIDDAKNRADQGYYKLDEELYPTEQEWFSHSSSTNVRVSYRRKLSWIKIEDAFTFIPNASAGVLAIHKSELPENAVRVASINERKTWAAADVELVETTANRKVVVGVHDVRQAFDGKYYFTRSLKTVKLFGETVFYPADMDPKHVVFKELPAKIREQIARDVASVNQLANAKKKALFNTVARSGDMLCPKNEVAGGGLDAAYIFEYRDIPLKLVEPWLRGDCDAVKITDMNEERKVALHTIGRMVMEEVDKLWAARPKTATGAVETLAEVA